MTGHSTSAYISTLGNRKKSGTPQKFLTRVLKTPPIDGHTDWVRALAFSPNYQFLASGSADDTIRLWSLSAGVEVSLPGRHEDCVSSLVFSDDSRLLASGSKDGKIRIWDIENLFAHVNLGRTGLKPNMNREASFLGRHEDGVRALSFHRIAESLLVDVRMVQSNCGMCPLIPRFLPSWGILVGSMHLCFYAMTMFLLVEEGKIIRSVSGIHSQEKK